MMQIRFTDDDVERLKNGDALHFMGAVPGHRLTVTAEEVEGYEPISTENQHE